MASIEIITEEYSIEKSMFRDRHIVLGVTGSIAAYKSAELVRLLKKAGAAVQVLMTTEATRFITPLTLGTLSENEVLSEVFPNNESGSWTKHIQLGLSADILLIAPATAQTIAKLANGFCDSMLTATALSARCPVVVCPAMDHDMYEHPSTQRNLRVLRDFGYFIMPPNEGALASGLIGKGRLPEPQQILDFIEPILNPIQPLKGKTVLITAGPTREPIDPVRYISNHSSGTMGYEIAKQARDWGANVILVSGVVSLPKPEGITTVDVESAQDMYEAVHQYLAQSDIIIAAAAVADYTPTSVSNIKIKKNDDELKIDLKRTPDILASIGKVKEAHQTLVGFALETNNAVEHAKGKLVRKNLDWIVLNDLSNEGAGFGAGTNRISILGKDGSQRDFPVMPKPEVAKTIWEHLLAHISA